MGGRICGQAWTAATAKARGYPAGGLATILSATSSRFIPVSLGASGAFGLSDRVCFLAGAWLCGWQLAVFLHKCSRTALTVAPQHPPGHGRPPQCHLVARRVPLCLVGVHLVPFKAYFGAGWTLYWRGLFAGAPPPQPAANQPQTRFLAPSGGCRVHLAVVALARPTLVCLRAILPVFWYHTMHISSYS